MSIAAGSARAGRRSRAGSSRPGLLGRGAAIAGGLAGRARGRMRGARTHHRGRGITARELRGFRKVTNLLRTVGMHPRGLGHRRHKLKRS
jgi:hypothetical protein